MSLAKRLVFAFCHPRQTWLYLSRSLTLKRARRLYKPDHQIPLLDGEIIQTKILHAFTKLSLADYKTEAEQILQGKFNFYANRNATLPLPLPWHQDFFASYTWDKNQFCHDIPYSYPQGVDIKHPWELSRAHHLLTVAIAADKLEERIVAKYYQNTINDWMDQNPIYYGVNWKVAMEVAIRAANWLAAYAFLPPTALNPQFKKRLLGSLQEHGRFIFANLEQFGSKSNHFFSDLVGLIWIGLLCPDIPESKKWLDYGLREFSREVMHQFNPDGLGFEASIAYHHLVLEMAGFTLLLCQEQQITLKPDVVDRINRAFSAVIKYSKPNNEIPQIGDNDSGRFLIWDNYSTWPSLNHQHLVTLGRNIFPDSTFEPNTSKLDFPNFQLGIIQNQPWWAALYSPKIGQDGNGGHNHNDAGSFELAHQNTNLIIDPGTGHYTSEPDLRNTFRSHRSHNAPHLSDTIELTPSNLFQAHDYAKGTVVKLDSNNLEARISYADKTWLRKVTIAKRSTTVFDKNLTDAKEFQVCLTLNPDLKPKIINSQEIELSNLVTLKLKQGEAELIDTMYSPSYSMVIHTAGILLHSSQAELEFQFIEMPK